MSFNWNDIFTNAAVLSEGIAVFTAIALSRNLPDKRLFVFPIILAIIFSVELGSGLFITNDWKPLTYNLLSIITFSGYSYIFFNHIKDDKYKNIIKICVLVYMISILINCWCANIIHESHQISYIVGGINMILFAVMYFLSILKNSKSLTFKHDLMCWISVGLLLFYVGYLPIKLSRFYFSIHLNPYLVLKKVQILLIVIMNFCFTLGLVWMKKK